MQTHTSHIQQVSTFLLPYGDFGCLKHIWVVVSNQKFYAWCLDGKLEAVLSTVCALKCENEVFPLLSRLAQYIFCEWLVAKFEWRWHKNKQTPKKIAKVRDNTNIKSFYCYCISYHLAFYFIIFCPDFSSFSLYITYVYKSNIIFHCFMIWEIKMTCVWRWLPSLFHRICVFVLAVCPFFRHKRTDFKSNIR